MLVELLAAGVAVLLVVVELLAAGCSLLVVVELLAAGVAALLVVVELLVVTNVRHPDTVSNHERIAHKPSWQLHLGILAYK